MFYLHGAAQISRFDSMDSREIVVTSPNRQRTTCHGFDLRVRRSILRSTTVCPESGYLSECDLNICESTKKLCFNAVVVFKKENLPCPKTLLLTIYANLQTSIDFASRWSLGDCRLLVSDCVALCIRVYIKCGHTVCDV